jgi:ABC-type lipoprotein export system ATPase subunit
VSFTSLQNISKHYCFEKTKQQVLSGVDLKIEKGAAIAIVGPSGSGKSTLLKILGLLDAPSSGSITMDGIECGKMSESKQTIFRRELVGFIFQSYNLLPDFTALENVMFAQDILGSSKKMALEKAKDLFAKLNISHRYNNYPSQLSGGEQQRVAIARSLINNPKLILADEPTGNLDSENTKNVAAVLESISKEHNITTITVTHDINVAKKADKIYVLNEGKLERQS